MASLSDFRVSKVGDGDIFDARPASNGMQSQTDDYAKIDKQPPPPTMVKPKSMYFIFLSLYGEGCY